MVSRAAGLSGYLVSISRTRVLRSLKAKPSFPGANMEKDPVYGNIIKNGQAEIQLTHFTVIE